VLLRLSIGWHFLYEGLYKIDSYRTGLRPFSAEAFLASAKGPLRNFFRSMLDDPDGLERLDAAHAAARLDLHLQELADKYRLTAEQRQQAQQKAAELKKAIQEYLSGEETAKKVAEYRDRLAELERMEAMRQVPFGPDRLPRERRELETLRDELLGPIQKRFDELTAFVESTLTEQQRKAAEQVSPLAATLGLPFDLTWPRRKIDQINLVTMCGLTLCGGLLLLGLFTRLAAFAGAVFVFLCYLAYPPPPLGAALPGEISHFAYIDWRFIEGLALLVLATIPTGRWLGIDAWIHGLITRPLAAKLFGRKKEAASSGA